ncbi:hypothetical protein KP509_24G008400 [Ceratopteris richardii]|nr:hypothetical protein KP509_24G008400 [Ceratopteris richardii]
MDAAKTKLHKPSGSSSSSSTEGVDVGKLAGAAGTLIGAVSHYGKFEETGHGKYVHKAQDFLQSYAAKHGSHGNSAVPPPTSGHHGDGHGASGYPPSQNHQSPSQPYSADGYGYQGHTSGSHQSASQPYPAAGYTGNYGNQGHTNVHANANNEPPMAYPPPGYPTSGTGHHRAGS